MSRNEILLKLSQSIKTYQNFPRDGVNFKDISPILSDVELRTQAMQLLSNLIAGSGATCLAALDARGFLLGAILAEKLSLPLIMIRKPSKLPGDVYRTEYNLEYGSNSFELSADILKQDSQVIIVDDLLATGGSVNAAKFLIEQSGSKVIGVCCLVELLALNGRTNVTVPIHSLLKYTKDDELVLEQSSTIEKLSNEFDTTNLHVSRFELPEEPCIVLHSLEMIDFAKRLCSRFPYKFRILDVEWKNFPDGYPNITFPGIDKLRNQNVVFIGSLYDHKKLFEQSSLVLALTRQLVKSLHIVFPYFAPGTMERVDKEGMLATAETMSKFISSIPLTRNGKSTLMIYDIHALANRFYFSDNVEFKPNSAIKSLFEYIKLRWGTVTIAFPDDGAYKRFSKVIPPGTRMIVCSKVRIDDKRIIKITDRHNFPSFLGGTNAAMTDVLIIDDLVQTGTTLYECMLALKREGAQRVSAFVTHAVFPNESYSRFLPGRDREGFDTFLITDTNPQVVEKLQEYHFKSKSLCEVKQMKKPFEVISIVNDLGQELSQDLQHIRCKRSLKIALASTNKDKHNAVKYAFSSMCPQDDSTVYGYNVESFVSPQPFGKEEIVAGAKNRMKHLLREIDSSYNYAISIENGIIEKNGKLYDIGYILGVNKHDTFHAWTEKVQIPDDIANKWLSLPNKSQITAGSMMGEGSNWHSRVAGKSRSYLLAKALNSFE